MEEREQRLSETFSGLEAREGQELESEPGTDRVEEEEVSAVEDPAKLKALVEDYRRRNSGLQRRLQQELQARRELESRIRQYEELAYAATLQNLSPQDRIRKLQEFRQERMASSRLEEIKRLEMELEQKAKLIVATEFSRRYGVPVDDLMVFDTPEEMERFAKRAGRNRPQAPRFEGVEPSPAPREKPKSLDEAVEAFRKAARRRGLI